MMSDKNLPAISKAQHVLGKTLRFRNALLSDAPFILSLRTDDNKSKFLSQVSHDLDGQKRWMMGYESSTDQAYFVIELKEVPIGTVRLYDARGYSFCWGSWILINDKPSSAAIESALMVYSYAVHHLRFSSAHFDVRKGNESVWKFHERFGAQRVSEDTTDYFYTLDLSSIKKSMEVYSRFLPKPVIVEPL
jgi:RimJ/RimL family protein N-acetyltransferase